MMYHCPTCEVWQDDISGWAVVKCDHCGEHMIPDPFGPKWASPHHQTWGQEHQSVEQRRFNQ